MTDCEQNKQQIIYCEMNAHFQNGIAGQAIKDVWEQAQKQLLYAWARWPEVIHLALWPYAVRYAVYIYNTCLLMMMVILDWNALLESGAKQKWTKTIFVIALYLPSEMISREIEQFQNDLLALDWA